MFEVTDNERRDIHRLTTQETILYTEKRMAGATHAEAIKYAKVTEFKTADHIARHINRGQ